MWNFEVEEDFIVWSVSTDSYIIPTFDILDAIVRSSGRWEGGSSTWWLLSTDSSGQCTKKSKGTEGFFLKDDHGNCWDVTYL